MASATGQALDALRQDSFMMTSRSSFERSSDQEAVHENASRSSFERPSDQAVHEHASRSSFERPSGQEAVHENGAVPFANNTNQTQIDSLNDQNSPLMESEKKHSNQNPTHARFGMSQLGFLKPWWTELIACVVVLLAIMALVLTLAIHQNQPLPNWPFGISVNSLVSVFVVILKGGMLLILSEGISQAKWAWFRNPRPIYHFSAFHEGSQGPLGAATLLWTLRGRQIAASTAALITIIALAIDPFTQQIIDYYSQPLAISGRQAGIPRTNNFTQAGGVFTGLPINQPLYNGFFSSGRPGDSNPSFDCPTGNCTFEPYYTVGICSDCNDITSQVVVSENCDVCRVPDSGYQGDSCTQTLPDANLTITQCDYDDIVFTSSTKFTGYYSSLQSPLDLSFQNTYFQAMMYSASQKGCPGQDAPYFSENGSCLRAVECGLYPCARAYTGEVKGGNFTETLISAYPMPLASSPTVDDPYCFYALRLGCVTNNGKNTLKAQGYSFAGGQDWLQYNCTSRVQNANIIPDQCIYEFSYEPANALAINFQEHFFEGTLENANVAPTVQLSGSIQLQVLFDSGNNTLESINNTMSRVANFLTTYVRENGDKSNSASAPGTMFQNETFIRVRWAWFTLPAALALFTLIFFVYTLVEIARRERHTNWKSSPLALLFHGLDKETQERYSRIDDLDEMDEKAKEVNVRLHKDGDRGWELVAVGK